MPEDWNPVHPDTLVGAELDELVAMFRDVDWTNRDAVQRRVEELRALSGGRP